MNAIAEMIYRETQRLPQHGIEAKSENFSLQDWQPFFNCFTRTVIDVQPFNRDEVYTDRLR